MIGAALLLGQVAQQAQAAPAPLDRKNYQAVRAEAQKLANETGFDYGVSKDYFSAWSFRMLPQRRNRYGIHHTCEAVMCEILAKCRPGHGPCA